MAYRPKRSPRAVTPFPADSAARSRLITYRQGADHIGGKRQCPESPRFCNQRRPRQNGLAQALRELERMGTHAVHAGLIPEPGSPAKGNTSGSTRWANTLARAFSNIAVVLCETTFVKTRTRLMELPRRFREVSYTRLSKATHRLVALVAIPGSSVKSSATSSLPQSSFVFVADRGRRLVRAFT